MKFQIIVLILKMIATSYAENEVICKILDSVEWIR